MFVISSKANRALLQGGGGSSGGYSGGSSGSVGTGSSGNNGYYYADEGTDSGSGGYGIAYGLMFGVFVTVILYLGIKHRWFSKMYAHIQTVKRRKSFNEDPDQYVNDPTATAISGNPFIDGAYSGYYKQYGAKYDMEPFKLIFDNEKVKGYGEDRVGTYNIDGIYSEKTKRMALNKTYIPYTGDLRQNFGHTVQIRLQLQEEKCENVSRSFQGEYYVKTIKYEGSGEWSIHKDDNVSTQELAQLSAIEQEQEGHATVDTV